MKALFFSCGTRDLTASVGILALRLGFGLLMLIGHGLPKLRNFQAILDNPKRDFPTPDFFPLNWMSEAVSLGAAVTTEVGASLLIILGLSTRWAAFFLGFTMVVAAFAVLADAVWFYVPGSAAPFKELALLYLMAMMALILTGPGRFSLDSLIDRERRGRLKISL